MSSLSKRSLHEKNIARKHLEKCAQQEIDEYCNSSIIDDQIDREHHENEEFKMELGIYDDEEYEQQYADDYYWFEDECHLEEPIDVLDDVYDFPAYIDFEVGTYYKTIDDRTFLCCQLLNRDKVLINVHTGKEEYVPQYKLQKVG